MFFIDLNVASWSSLEDTEHWTKHIQSLDVQHNVQFLCNSDVLK